MTWIQKPLTLVALHHVMGRPKTPLRVSIGKSESRAVRTGDLPSAEQCCGHLSNWRWKGRGLGLRQRFSTCIALLCLDEVWPRDCVRQVHLLSRRRGLDAELFDFKLTCSRPVALEPRQSDILVLGRDALACLRGFDSRC